MSSLEQRIIAESDDAVIYSDITGTIQLWNRGATRLFGYSADEAMGQTLDLIIPSKHRQRHWQGYHQVVETGETQYAGKLLTVPAQHKDGSRVIVEFTVLLIKEAKGHVEGIAAFLRDVTQRQATERELRSELATLRERTNTVN